MNEARWMRNYMRDVRRAPLPSPARPPLVPYGRQRALSLSLSQPSSEELLSNLRRRSGRGSTDRQAGQANRQGKASRSFPTSSRRRPPHRRAMVRISHSWILPSPMAVHCNACYAPCDRSWEEPCVDAAELRVAMIT